MQLDSSRVAQFGDHSAPSQQHAQRALQTAHMVGNVNLSPTTCCIESH